MANLLHGFHLLNRTEFDYWDYRNFYNHPEALRFHDDVLLTRDELVRARDNFLFCTWGFEELIVGEGAKNKRLERTRHEPASLASCVGEPLKHSVRTQLAD